MIPRDEDIETISIAGLCTELGDCYVVNVVHKRKGDERKTFDTIQEALDYYQSFIVSES